MARYSLSPSDLPTSIAGMVFRTRVTIPPLCRSALSCRKSSYPLRVKRWASVRWVSWMQMMSTPSLFRNPCSSGFFFRSPSAFHCAKTSGTADVSGWLDKQFACCLLFSSWFALPVAAGGPLWGWGPGTVTAWCSRDEHHTAVCQSAWPCWVRCVVTGLLLVLSLCRRSARCPQPSLPTSEQLMAWAWSVLLLDWLPPPATESNLPDQLPLAGNTLGRWVTWTSSALAIGCV